MHLTVLGLRFSWWWDQQTNALHSYRVKVFRLKLSRKLWSLTSVMFVCVFLTGGSHIMLGISCHWPARLLTDCQGPGPHPTYTLDSEPLTSLPAKPQLWCAGFGLTAEPGHLLEELSVEALHLPFSLIRGMCKIMIAVTLQLAELMHKLQVFIHLASTIVSWTWFQRRLLVETVFLYNKFSCLENTQTQAISWNHDCLSEFHVWASLVNRKRVQPAVSAYQSSPRVWFAAG